MYMTIAEMQERGDMSTVAERTHASSVTLNTKAMTVRGYDFVPSEISETERDFMFRSLFPVGLEAFVQNPSEGMERDIADHLFTAEHLLVMRSDGTYSFGMQELGAPRPIAFRMWRSYDTPIGRALYLAGMCVLPKWQGMGIGQKMTEYVLAREQYDWVFTATQNPMAKHSMDNAIGATSYPLFGAMVGEYMGACGMELAKALGKQAIYEPATGILRGNYGASLYGKLPVSRDAKYQALFDKLDRESGDAYLCFAKA